MGYYAILRIRLAVLSVTLLIRQSEIKLFDNIVLIHP